MQSYQSIEPRSSTPRVPPGFEHTHAHPVPPTQEKLAQPPKPTTQRNVSSSTAPTIPAVPFLAVGHRATTPKPKANAIGASSEKDESRTVQSDNRTPVQAKTKGDVFGQGSPQQGTAPQKTKPEKPDLEVHESDTLMKDDVSVPAAKGDTKAKKTPAVKPGKIELPPPPIPSTLSQASSVPATEFVPVPVSTPTLHHATMGSPSLASQPPTPGTATPSESAKASTRARILNLKIHDITSTDPTPASATTEKSSIAGPSLVKRGSRRPSISSAQLSRPSTPAMSERPSHDASRANSPPPSIVGSAPERTKSKAQQKKERKEKSRKTAEVSDAPSPASTPVVEDVAPVIARQKKQKKRVESNPIAKSEDVPSAKKATEPKQPPVADKHPSVERSISPKPKQPEPVATVPSSKTQTKAGRQSQKQSASAPEKLKEESVSEQVEEPRKSYSVLDALDEADQAAGPNADPIARQAALRKLLQEHVSSMPKIISSLLQSGDLSKDSTWLNPPPFNSAAYKLPPDSRRGQEYLDGNAYSANDAFGYIYLPTKEKQALKDGNAVSVVDSGEKKDDLLKRCLVTHNGWVLRHLSADESEKVLELEERRQMYTEEFGDVGTMAGLGALEPDDFTNLGGGMERLSRHGERHSVVWIAGEDGQMVEDDEFERFDEENEAVDRVPVLSDEDPERDEYEGDDISNDDFERDDHLDMPGAWRHAPRSQRLGRAEIGKEAVPLPGLSPHSKSSASNLLSDGPAAIHERLAQHEAATRNGPSAAVTSPAPVNLRALDNDALQKRVQETQKALEVARKEMEKMEKMANKKVKDISRWRDGIVGSLVSAGGKS
jgi:CCR4-NOT transcription complex subunit 4